MTPPRHRGLASLAPDESTNPAVGNAGGTLPLAVIDPRKAAVELERLTETTQKFITALDNARTVPQELLDDEVSI